MLFKEYPFKASGNDYKTLYHKIMNEEPSYPKEFRDKEAIDLIKKMLIKDSNNRITLEEIKSHDWVTVLGKFPLEDKNIESSSDSEN